MPQGVIALGMRACVGVWVWVCVWVCVCVCVCERGEGNLTVDHGYSLTVRN